MADKAITNGKPSLHSPSPYFCSHVRGRAVGMDLQPVIKTMGPVVNIREIELRSQIGGLQRQKTENNETYKRQLEESKMRAQTLAAANEATLSQILQARATIQCLEGELQTGEFKVAQEDHHQRLMHDEYAERVASINAQLGFAVAELSRLNRQFK
ncbi:hypothetical protein P154DRAFT_519911 [Amniculicola lignicola CBS 123094]|uniref:Uncharacterized protein n=1 Tax=Amniculicola lignicola CBS 123094 TaxID=1392246 RepID=A0A6A5X119_9PLEO|nr:hypothetical protein P154DRAFT_519911 [Amniculicola lignicola CBS 123094]